jgi:hypothetical protein
MDSITIIIGILMVSMVTISNVFGQDDVWASRRQFVAPCPTGFERVGSNSRGTEWLRLARTGGLGRYQGCAEYRAHVGTCRFENCEQCDSSF